MTETKIKAILFIIWYIDKELSNTTIADYERVLYLKWRKKVNQDKLKQMILKSLHTIEELEKANVKCVIVTYADKKTKSFDIVKWSIFGKQIMDNLECDVEFKLNN